MFETIKSVVTIPMILSKYASYSGANKRIPCPIHKGNNLNFAFRDNSFICHTCGAHGDVVNLVSLLMNISIKEAASVIEYDFGLSKPDDFRKIQREYEEKRKREDKDKRNVQSANNILCSRYKHLWSLRNAKAEFEYSKNEAELIRVGYYCDCFIYESFKKQLQWVNENVEYLKMLEGDAG